MNGVRWLLALGALLVTGVSVVWNYHDLEARARAHAFAEERTARF
jgi:hypothetical protein